MCALALQQDICGPARLKPEAVLRGAKIGDLPVRGLERREIAASYVEGPAKRLKQQLSDMIWPGLRYGQGPEPLDQPARHNQ